MQTLQTRVELGRDKSPSFNGELIRPDHSVSLHLEDLTKKSQFLLSQVLPKSEALVVVNIGGDKTAPYVTIKLLIHTVHSVLIDRSRDMTWWQFKNKVAIIRWW